MSLFPPHVPSARKWNLSSRKWNGSSILGCAVKPIPLLLFRLEAMVPEKIHEFLIVIRPDIKQDAHPAITTSGR